MSKKVKICPKCGKQLPNNECRFCHIVPKTYQKKWSKNGTESTVYYFDKNLNPILFDDRNSHRYENKKGGNLSNFMGEWDYYILNDFDREYIGDAPNCIESYFDNKLEKLWSDVYKLFIDGSARKGIITPIRNLWNQNYIKTKETVFAIHRDDFGHLKHIFDEIDRFIWIQYVRRFENMYPYFIESCKVTKQPYNCFSNEYIRTCYLKLLYDCVNNVPRNVLDTFLIVKSKKFSPVAIFATDNTKFILSDNPVVNNMGSTIDNNLGGGLYFAISPDVLIAFLDLSKWRKDNKEMKIDDLVLVAGTDDFIKYYNKLLLDRSFEKVAFNSGDIKNHIAKDLTNDKAFSRMMGLFHD